MTITASRFFDGAKWHGPSEVTLAEGHVAGIAPAPGRCEHAMLVPGLVDLQMNGFATIDIWDCDEAQLIELDRMLFELGTLHWLATIVTAPLDRLSGRIAFLDEVVRSGSCPGLVGIHIEGPFLGGAAGAHRKDWIIGVDQQWLANLPASVRMVTMAPEQPDAAAATGLLTARGVTVSIGHTTATMDQFDGMRSAGASMVTHLFNAMTGVHHRQDGIALRSLVSDDVNAGLIADMVHVSPEAVLLAFRAKSPRRICLVSDSVAWDTARARSRGVAVANGAPRLADGTLAGSSTPLSQCLRNCVDGARVAVEEAVVAATMTPALTIGRPGLASVEVGSPASLVAFDDQLCVTGVWRRLVSHRG
jgi:N-acetylglucosamine-6-phosphate deacetylase